MCVYSTVRVMISDGDENVKSAIVTSFLPSPSCSFWGEAGDPLLKVEVRGQDCSSYQYRRDIVMPVWFLPFDGLEVQVGLRFDMPRYWLSKSSV